MDHSIIVIDDEPDFLDSIKRGLITSGFRNIQLVAAPLEAARRLSAGEVFDVALIDITMPGLTGQELLDKFKSQSPETECIMVTAIDEARVAVECLRKGAYDYLVKPISKEDLVQTLNRALERKRLVDLIDIGKKATPPPLSHPQAFSEIVTGTTAMHKVLKEAELHARSNVPILITGETGTGKELLARAVHLASHRARRRFTAINMDALDTNLFAAEFFGHTKGAFTGAQGDRNGYLEEAHRGTLFLDEIGNLPTQLQGKLLRVLQEGEFIKIGANRPLKVDVRFVAATNADLDKLMKQHRFRRDLYYRLRGSWLHLPPLRERREDIPLLVRHFLNATPTKDNGVQITEESMALLMHYRFPGNIRELKAIIQSAANLSQKAPIAPQHLPPQIARVKVRPSTGANATAADTEVLPMAQVERRHILAVYERCGQNKSEAARLLEISLSTLRRKLEAYGVT
jgi:two-component system response regulator AtoC